MWHRFWLCVYNNAPTIQVVIGCLTLIGLAVYTIYTRALVQIGQRQIEASFRPIISIEVVNTEIVLRNVGTGPAINVKYCKYFGPCDSRELFLPVLGTGQSLQAGTEYHFLISHLTKDSRVYEISYESIAKTRYRSLADWIEHETGWKPVLSVGAA